MRSAMRMAVSVGKNFAIGNSVVAELDRRRRQVKGFYGGAKNDPSYPLGVFKKQTTWLAEGRTEGLAGADVLEIGPGGNVGVAVLMFLAGAQSVTCLDSAPWARTAEADAIYPRLIELAAGDQQLPLLLSLREQGLRKPEQLASTLLERISYLASDDIATTNLPAESLDAIYSHACFEHFADPRLAIHQIARLLRSGGATSHQIDLRDHRNFYDPPDFLSYGYRVWNLASSRSPNSVRNRWRLSQYRSAFEEEGLELVRLDIPSSFPVSTALRREFHRQFRSLSLEDLSATGIIVIAHKP